MNSWVVNFIYVLMAKSSVYGSIHCPLYTNQYIGGSGPFAPLTWTWPESTRAERELNNFKRANKIAEKKL